MALSRKQWNNIIIGACLFMVLVLSFMNEQTSNVPADVAPLFDKQNRLTQLQLSGVWLTRVSPELGQRSQDENVTPEWQCDERVLNCQIWAQAWSQVQVSTLGATPQASTKPQELLLSINQSSESQLWLYYAAEGWLISASRQWYQVPPSLRSALIPNLEVETQP
jgi:hypothetical protein